MNKPVFLGLSILELCKILMYEFWYYFIKPKYGRKAEFCEMYTNSFTVYIKTDYIYKEMAEGVVKLDLILQIMIERYQKQNTKK